AIGENRYECRSAQVGERGQERGDLFAARRELLLSRRVVGVLVEEFFVEIEDRDQQPPADVLLLGALGQFPLAELHHQVDRSLGLGKIALGAAPLPSFGFKRFLSFPFLFSGLLVRLLGRFLLLGKLVVGSFGLQLLGGDQDRGDREADGAKDQKQE